MEPGEQVYSASNYQIQTVQAFLEKPTAAQADAALAAGALSEYISGGGQGGDAVGIGVAMFSRPHAALRMSSCAIGTSTEAKTIETIYEHMPTHDFSSELLQLIPAQFVVIEMAGVLWSDSGYTGTDHSHAPSNRPATDVSIELPGPAFRAVRASSVAKQDSGRLLTQP